jgi:hypothetical protein
MHAAFFLKGNSIAAQTVGIIDMRAIAPTFAEILGVPLPSAERPPVKLERTDTQRAAASP